MHLKFVSVTTLIQPPHLAGGGGGFVRTQRTSPGSAADLTSYYPPCFIHTSDRRWCTTVKCDLDLHVGWAVRF